MAVRLDPFQTITAVSWGGGAIIQSGDVPHPDDEEFIIKRGYYPPTPAGSVEGKLKGHDVTSCTGGFFYDPWEDAGGTVAIYEGEGFGIELVVDGNSLTDFAGMLFDLGNITVLSFDDAAVAEIRGSNTYYAWPLGISALADWPEGSEQHLRVVPIPT